MVQKLLPEQVLRERHAGARILLAEGNPVSLEIALTLLEEAGLAVDTAQTADEALRRTAAAPYDLILLDAQWSGLDLRATGVPIVMMATVAAGAGIDDALAKPLDPALLYERLLRGLAGAAPPQRVLNAARGLAFFGGKRELYLRGLQQFAGLYEGGIVGAPAYLAQAGAETAEALRRELHSIAGAAGAVGAEALAEQAGRLGDALRNDPLAPDNAALLAELERRFADLFAAIRAAAPG